MWRGGPKPTEKLAQGRSWTRSYSVACAFALSNSIREPIVLIRHLRREHALAWIGGIEKEVILTTEALVLPAQQHGSLPDWRRHRARKKQYFF